MSQNLPELHEGKESECLLEGEEHYELEIQSRPHPDKGSLDRDFWTHIACSRDPEHLEAIASRIQVRGGKTFEEELKLLKIDEHGDIVETDALKLGCDE